MRAQLARLYFTVAVDGAEQRPAVYSGLFLPRLRGANRASVGVSAVGNPNLAARPLLVRLGSPQRHRQAILAEGAILNV
jgi:hypothetical protein